MTWDAVFLEEMFCNWQVARRHVEDPTLREMLAVDRKLPGEGGQNNQFRARTIAFDRMLRYELKTGHRFQHILVLRPDVAPYLGHENPALVVSSVKDSVFFYNDLVAIFSRKFATYMFTLPATLRSFHTTLDKHAWQSLHSKLMVPHAHAALQGLPICGGMLQAIPDMACTSQNFQTAVGFVRDLWRVRGPQRVCVDQARGASLKWLKDYFAQLGIKKSLVENLALCHEDM